VRCWFRLTYRSCFAARPELSKILLGHRIHRGCNPTVRRGREVLAELAVSHLSRGAAIARYFAVVFEEESEEFGGAKLGVHGESLALPPIVHDLLQGRTVEELKADRLFFVYYNRGHLDETDRLWHDLAIMKSYRCLPVYRTALPKAKNVRVVASCSRNAALAR